MEAVDAQELLAVRTDYDALTQEEKLFLELRRLPNVRLVVEEEEAAAAAAAVVVVEESNGMMREDCSPRPSSPLSSTPQPAGSAPKRAKLKVRRTAEDA